MPVIHVSGSKTVFKCYLTIIILWKNLEAFKKHPPFCWLSVKCRTPHSAYPGVSCHLMPKHRTCIPVTAATSVSHIPSSFSKAFPHCSSAPSCNEKCMYVVASFLSVPQYHRRRWGAERMPSSELLPGSSPSHYSEAAARRCDVRHRCCRQHPEPRLLHPSSPPSPRRSLGTLRRLDETQDITAGPGDEGPTEGKGCKWLHQQPCRSMGEGEGRGAEGSSGNNSADKE